MEKRGRSPLKQPLGPARRIVSRRIEGSSHLLGIYTDSLPMQKIRIPSAKMLVVGQQYSTIPNLSTLDQLETARSRG
jgi:hypothetical protein